MKRNTLLLMLLCLSLSGFAQEVAIEQTINQPINSLIVHSGWDVRLMHRDTEGYRIAIVVPEQFAGIAAETQVCNLTDDALNILENTMLPRGTVLEVEGNMNFREIEIGLNAKAVIDHLYVPEGLKAKGAKGDAYYCYVGKNADLSIHHLVSAGEPFISLCPESKLNIDTITGSGKPIIEMYNANFQYGTSLLDGEILVKENKSPTWFYEKKSPKVIKTKMVDGQPMTTEHYKIWNAYIALDVGIAFRKHQTPVEFNSPFTNNGIYSVNFGLSTGFRFGEHWTLRTGLRYNFNEYYMAHQLKLNENGLENIDGQTPIQQNRLVNGYLGIPVELYFNWGEPLQSGFSVDAFFGRLTPGSSLKTLSAEDNYKNWQFEDADWLFNPWKLEVGVSFNTGLIGFIHGIRVYTNLLPEYNKSVTTEKFRSIGVEIKF